MLAHGMPVLLACNKSDVGVKAHTPEFIRKMLEKELCVDENSLSRGGGEVWWKIYWSEIVSTPDLIRMMLEKEPCVAG